MPLRTLWTTAADCSEIHVSIATLGTEPLACIRQPLNIVTPAGHLRSGRLLDQTVLLRVSAFVAGAPMHHHGAGHGLFGTVSAAAADPMQPFPSAESSEDITAGDDSSEHEGDCGLRSNSGSCSPVQPAAVDDRGLPDVPAAASKRSVLDTPCKSQGGSHQGNSRGQHNM